MTAAITAGGIVLLAGLATPAAALPFNWQPAAAPPAEISQPTIMQRRARSPRAVRTTRSKEKTITTAAESTKDLPARVKEPVHIVVSIDKQQLTLYSGAQPIAHSRVSTGTASHPTPTGVFSIIQKNRWHRSNLYNDAPMFYMQRITWSGVAMHQGIVPNHPASHGCIRLPEAFARQLWGITKLGARVIVTRGDAAPVAFAHPRLFTYKQLDPVVEEQWEQAASEGSSTDLVRQAYRALEGAQAFSKPGETATDASRPGEQAFNAAARAEQREPAAPPASSADVVRSAYNSFDLIDYRRGKSRAIAMPVPTPKPTEVVRPSLKPGPVSVFISRKEGRVFVRKGFEPVFDAPVMIERPDQPLGTHVFTALAFNDDNTTLRWTVTTVPTSGAMTYTKRKNGEPAQAPAGPPSSAAGALDRITIPQGALDRISGLVSAGASLVISDKGLGPETGLGTDFIVLTR
jgi:lipoprotein-anchoring transpeptidase ErfK/SrfK